MTKQEQRKHIKDLLREKDAQYLAEQSQLAAEKLCTLHEFQNANVILVYNAMRRECDPSYIVRKAAEMGIAIAYPLCIEGNNLKICVPHDETCFNVGAYGIIEPDESKSSVLSPADLDLIVVPGLGFDENKNRLGRGAGYYDRLLKDAFRAYKVGFCFSEQIFDSVVTEDHDMKMDCVVTPQKIIR